MTTPTISQDTPAATVAIVPAWAPVALTDRGRAAARLSDFQDAWAELTQADRAWFAEWLTTLLVDACEGELATTA